MLDIPLAPDAPVALRLSRGVGRLFASLSHAVLFEARLGNGRRADVLGLARDGRIVIAEVKSGLPDFRADRKWPDYTDYCDAFYFAVAAEFPLHRLPEPCGLIIADEFGAAIRREAPALTLSPARRRALTLRLARQAASKLHRLADPAATPPA